MLYWFAVMWVALASSRGCGKVCSRSFKGNTGMWGGWTGGGAGIAAGGHVASADMLRIGFTIIYIGYIQKRENILTHFKKLQSVQENSILFID